MTVERPLTCSTKITENGYDNPMPIENNSCCKQNSNGLNSFSASIENSASDANAGVYVIPINDSRCSSTQDQRRNNEQCKQSNSEKQQYTYHNGTSINNGALAKVNNFSEKAYIDYDPYQHIQRKNPTSYWDTTFHLLKASLGTGILAMPNAFQNAGYAVGLIGTLIIGFLCTYNIHILVSSEYELCKRRKVPSMTYPETVQTAFEEGPSIFKKLAPFGRFITNLFLVTYQIGTSSIYAVFIASNLVDVCDTYFGTTTDIRLMMLYLLAPSIIICWVRNLKLLVPFSTIANAATILSFVFIFLFVFEELPSFEQRQPVGTIEGIPLFFGTVLFAMEAIGMVMPLKNQMKKPKKFGSLFGVLNASMLPISLLYAFIGFFGYLKYGSGTKGSITLNLPSEKGLAQAVKLLYSASIFITYALSNYVTFDILWNNSIKTKITTSSKVTRIFWEYVVRTAIVFFTFFLAAAVPDLEVFISFVGAFCLSSIGVAFPAIIQILTYWNHHQDAFQFSIMIFKNIIIVLIAILAFTIGVSSSVRRFVEGPSH